MMKRILVLTILSFVVTIKSFSQCIPDLTITTPGIFPDSATGLASGVVNMPYSQVLQMRIPADTTITIIIIGQVTIPIDSVHLSSFIGLPTGLNIVCGPPNCTYFGGTNGCALISGTPTDTGLFSLTAVIQTYYGGGTLAAGNRVDSLNYYTIRINSTAGLNELSSGNFMVEQNNPNPVAAKSTISYYVSHSGSAEFKMYNLLGKEIYHNTEKAIAGKNNLTVDARNFSPGIYMYSLTYNNHTITKRLVITGR